MFFSFYVDSIWISADDAYFVGEIYTLQDLNVWFCAEKGFLSIDNVFSWLFFMYTRQLQILWRT